MRDVGALILAAGDSSRLGSPKQLVRVGGESLVRRVTRAACDAPCDPVVVVTGDVRSEIEAELSALDVYVAQNSDWRRGMGTSIRCGVDALLQLEPEIGAVVIVACDQPQVDAALLANLVAVWRSTSKPIVASSYANTVGIPALFDRSCFDALLALDDERGAKRFILLRIEDTAVVPFPGGAIDIDTPADLKRLGAESA